MSRIGKKPVAVPSGVTATVAGQKVTMKGPKGELKFVVNDEVLIKLEDNTVAVTPANDSKDARAQADPAGFHRSDPPHKRSSPK